MNSMAALLSLALSMGRVGQIDTSQTADASSHIYSIVLDSISVKMHLSALWLLDSTITGYRLCRLQPAYTTLPFRNKADSASIKVTEMMPLFNETCDSSISILTHLPTVRSTLHTISYAQSFTTKDDLRAGEGIVALSQVAYSSDGIWALVFVEDYIGRLSGMGRFVLLRLDGGSWKMIASIPRWIS